MDFSAQQAYEFGFGALCAWREARSLGYQGMLAVAWTLNNRQDHPSVFGHDWPSVVLSRYQYSSMSPTDPQFKTFPAPAAPDWQQALNACIDAYTRQVADPTAGATMYYDDSISPPGWATDGSHTATIKLGVLNFFKVVPGRGPV